MREATVELVRNSGGTLYDDYLRGVWCTVKCAAEALAISGNYLYGFTVTIHCLLTPGLRLFAFLIVSLFLYKDFCGDTFSHKKYTSITVTVRYVDITVCRELTL
jgi:hypothetical protein